jgi:cell division control protein 45
MDADLKRKLREQMDAIAPEYGLDDLAYPSFVKSFGFRSQPLCAADVVESVSALMQAANGVRLQVENLDGQGGGEWFSGTRLWDMRQKSLADLNGVSNERSRAAGNADFPSEDDLQGADGSGSSMGRLWVKNFWVAFDSLGSE